MSEVTFSAEQVREIRRRLEAVEWPSFTGPERRAVLAAFPLKVTRYRTFEAPLLRNNGTYRVVAGRVEYCNIGLEDMGGWVTAKQGESVGAFAQRLVDAKDWTALAAFADICARPTEEVDDD